MQELAKSGQFLVAEARLNDPNFEKTVVLMISHDQEGSFGLVLNKASGFTLGQAAPQFASSILAEEQVCIGGPVEQTFLFTIYEAPSRVHASPGAIELIPGLYFEPDFVHFESETAPLLLELGLRKKFFAGYAGWSAGQLKDEFNEQAWFVLDGTKDLVFGQFNDDCWKTALRKKGGVYWALAETGFKPSIN